MNQKGVARFQQGEDKTITEFNGNAVVGLASEGQCEIRPIGDTYDSQKFIIVLQQSDGTSSERALTLSDESSGEDWTDVVFQQLQGPPSDRQLWTFEEIIATKRFVTLSSLMVTTRSIDAYLHLPQIPADVSLPYPERCNAWSLACYWWGCATPEDIHEYSCFP